MGGWLKVVAVILVPLLLLPLPLLLNSTEDGKLNLSPFHRTLLHPPLPPADKCVSIHMSCKLYIVKARLVKNGVLLMWFS